MFVGSINSKIRKLINTEKNIFHGRKICNGCSGNFTVEQILQGIDCEIWSNDIALYSSLIGNYLAGHEMKTQISDLRYSWIEPYMQDGGIGRIAAVSLLFEMLKQKEGNNLNQLRLYSHYKNNFDDYYEKSCERISKSIEQIRINKYTMIDVHDLYKNLSEEYVRLAFLPMYVGGYEKLYSRMESIIKWDAPAYNILTEERYEETVKFMRSGDFLYFSDHDRKEPDLSAIVKTGRLKNVYMYSNLDFRKRYIAPLSKFKIIQMPLLLDNYEITENSKIIFVKTDNQSLNYYKNLFLKKALIIQPAFCLFLFSSMVIFSDFYCLT